MNCAIHTDVPATAYCRTCGKALCENCKRDVRGAIYCEPCIAARLQSGTTTAPGVPVTVIQGAPSPALAGLLGFIPGVGAMYNGQFVKAFVHVVILAMLIVAVSHGGVLAPLFGMMIGAFCIYMVIEAYQTAKAKQFGLPNPDFLGLEHMFGVHENQPPAASQVQPVSSGQAPFQRSVAAQPPVGAFVLVALGVIFLLDNLGMVHFHRMWPLILIVLGLWIAYKRTTGRE